VIYKERRRERQIKEIKDRAVLLRDLETLESLRESLNINSELKIGKLNKFSNKETEYSFETESVQDSLEDWIDREIKRISIELGLEPPTAPPNYHPMNGPINRADVATKEEEER